MIRGKRTGETVSRNGCGKQRVFSQIDADSVTHTADADEPAPDSQLSRHTAQKSDGEQRGREPRNGKTDVRNNAGAIWRTGASFCSFAVPHNGRAANARHATPDEPTPANAKYAEPARATNGNATRATHGNAATLLRVNVAAPANAPMNGNATDANVGTLLRQRAIAPANTAANGDATHTTHAAPPNARVPPSCARLLLWLSLRLKLYLPKSPTDKQRYLSVGL